MTAGLLAADEDSMLEIGLSIGQATQIGDSRINRQDIGHYMQPALETRRQSCRRTDRNL